MTIAINVLKTRLQHLVNEKEYYDIASHNQKVRVLDLKSRISEIQYLIQRLEIDGRRTTIEEKEFQDSLGKL